MQIVKTWFEFWFDYYWKLYLHKFGNKIFTFLFSPKTIDLIFLLLTDFLVFLIHERWFNKHVIVVLYSHVENLLLLLLLALKNIYIKNRYIPDICCYYLEHNALKTKDSSPSWMWSRLKQMKSIKSKVLLFKLIKEDLLGINS